MRPPDLLRVRVYVAAVLAAIGFALSRCQPPPADDVFRVDHPGSSQEVNEVWVR